MTSLGHFSCLLGCATIGCSLKTFIKNSDFNQMPNFFAIFFLIQYRDFTKRKTIFGVVGTLTVGATYRNTKACGTFTKYIATASVTSYGATDSSIIEQKIVFARYRRGGGSKFLGE